jgi:ribosomal protein S18 acetylase RimI-like enzyme
MPSPFTAEPARPEELAPALRLIFQHLAEEEQVARVVNALTLICQGEIDPAGVAVIRQGKSLLGAMVSIPLPGAGALVWPPAVGPGPLQTRVEDALVRQARDWLRRGGAKVAQAMLPSAEASRAVPLLRNGFRHITSLWYLRHDLGGDQAGEDLFSTRNNLTFLGYLRANQDLFQETLLRTYEGTLDCPELNGVRDINEIMAGHRAQGKHDPELWSLLFRAGVPVGVLMLAEMPDWGALDISFLGVVPEARGGGLGRVLTSRALAEARRLGVEQLTLAVDCRNLPAWNLYHDLGFQPHELREVYLSFWDNEPALAF